MLGGTFMFSKLLVSGRNHTLLSIFVLGLCSFLALEARAQGSAANYVGNGGIHTIQGKIYTSNGRRSDLLGLKIRLNNVSSNDLSVIADTNGTFTFKNLVPGVYTVRIEGGEYFEDINENVEIDDPGSSNLSSTVRLLGGAKIVNIPIYLKSKVQRQPAAQVVNAKLVSVPKPALDSFEKAQKAITDGDDSMAISLLRESISLHKEFSIAWNLLGLLLQKRSDLTGAVNAFRSAVQYDTASTVAKLNLGCSLYNLKSYPEAERYLMEVLLAEPQSYRGHYYMGLTQVKLGRIDVAEQAFKKAIEVGEDQAGMAHYMLGGIYWSVKRYKEAAAELELYLKLEPNAKDAEKTRESIAELRRKYN